VLLTGPAALWAITELEARPAAGLRRAPSGSYPPPLARLAVAREVARQDGLPAGSGFFPADPERTPADCATATLIPGGQAVVVDWAERLAGCAPAVAASLLGLAAGAGFPLRSVGATIARAYDRGIIGGWRKELLGGGEPTGEESLEAARVVAAASVAAWQVIAEREDSAPGADAALALDAATARLAERVLAVLPECREPGTRAAGAAPDAGALARDILADLDADPGMSGGPGSRRPGRP
jgi:hypothetical protein